MQEGGARSDDGDCEYRDGLTGLGGVESGPEVDVELAALTLRCNATRAVTSLTLTTGSEEFLALLSDVERA